jgi:hypothetical protein
VVRNEINGDNLNNVGREASRHFRNKKRGYLKGKTNELPMNSKNKYIRDRYRRINEYKWGHQPRNSSVNDENGNRLADSHISIGGGNTFLNY